MPRYKFTVEYDGRGFVGWQRQANGPSIQAALEAAVKGFCGQTVTIEGAGRTDAGVHALGQVAHFELSADHAPHTVMNALNFHLRPAPIVVVSADLAAPDFHARFSATGRHYLYRILNRPAPPALERGRVWHVAVKLNARAMHRAAQALLGKHDFTTFRSVHCQSKSPVKTLDVLKVSRRGEEILVTASARSFLHHQVRSMDGTLKLVGEGKWTGAEVAGALAACDHSRAGPTAPADGLYLTAVDY